VVAYEPERAEVDVQLARPGFLVLTDTHYPGWRAEVNGAAARNLRADYLFPGHRPGFGRAPCRVSVCAPLAVSCLGPEWPGDSSSPPSHSCGTVRVPRAPAVASLASGPGRGLATLDETVSSPA
jgi:hypothetical protein